MKILKFAIIYILSLGLIACEDVMKQKVDFDVEIENADFIQFTDSAVLAPAGSEITFLFKGDPDFISFAYERFIPTNVSLKFSTQAAWGNHVENTLRILLSENFEGLSYQVIKKEKPEEDLVSYDFKKDSTNITTHAWKDISASANFPKKVNVKQESEISFNEYGGKKIVLAFQYKTEYDADWQPSWTIGNLRLENIHTKDNSLVSTYLATTMGFLPFDLLNAADPYQNKESKYGVWYTKNPTEMKIRQSPKKNPLNEDWLISKPIEVPLGFTENYQAKGIKKMTIAEDRYTHTFLKSGTYTITFRAANHNYLHQDVVSKNIKLIIKD